MEIRAALAPYWADFHRIQRAAIRKYARCTKMRLLGDYPLLWAPIQSDLLEHYSCFGKLCEGDDQLARFRMLYINTLRSAFFRLPYHLWAAYVPGCLDALATIFVALRLDGSVDMDCVYDIIARAAIDIYKQTHFSPKVYAAVFKNKAGRCFLNKNNAKVAEHITGLTVSLGLRYSDSVCYSISICEILLSHGWLHAALAFYREYGMASALSSYFGDLDRMVGPWNAIFKNVTANERACALMLQNARKTHLAVECRRFTWFALCFLFVAVVAIICYKYH